MLNKNERNLYLRYFDRNIYYKFSVSKISLIGFYRYSLISRVFWLTLAVFAVFLRMRACHTICPCWHLCNVASLCQVTDEFRLIYLRKNTAFPLPSKFWCVWLVAFGFLHVALWISCQDMARTAFRRCMKNRWTGRERRSDTRCWVLGGGRKGGK